MYNNVVATMSNLSQGEVMIIVILARLASCHVMVGWLLYSELKSSPIQFFDLKIRQPDFNWS